MALVQTVDVLAPVVDDPFTFGKIAAINSLSDCYAMGGRPLSALNVVGFPANMDPEILGEILKGGQEAVLQAGAVTLGGHTFQSDEIRYGLAITGLISPNRIVTNAGARVGDDLVLTKPLGTSTVVQTMVSRGAVPRDLHESIVSSMLTSNRTAAEIMMKFNPHACTDITGFSCLGHTWEMAAGSDVHIRLRASAIPVFSGVFELIRDGVKDGSAKMNQNSFESYVSFAGDIPEEYMQVLFGSETSGGILIAVGREHTANLLNELQSSGLTACVIGEVIRGISGNIEVIS